MRSIKIGHIGCGHMHSAGKLQCVKNHPDVFEVVGLFVPEEESNNSWNNDNIFNDVKRISLDEMLLGDTVDAVLIECDDWLMVKYAQVCADAGKHIHLDKPAGESIADYKALIHCAKQKNLTVQLAYMYRYNPAVQKMLDMVKNGELGDILQVDAVMSTRHTDEIRQWLSRFVGGTMHTFGCHIIDLVLLFCGMPDRIVPFKRKTMLDGIDVYDHDLAIFEYPWGISTVRTSSFEMNGYGRRQLVVCGTKGSVELKPLETNELQEYTKMYISNDKIIDGRHYSDIKKKIKIPTIAGRYDAMMLDFATMVRGQMENPFSYEYELSLQRACLAACGFDVDLKEVFAS